MMWGNAASLIAGGGAVYLNFDTGLMQNIIESLISSAGAFTNVMRCKYTAALMRGGWVGNSVQTATSHKGCSAVYLNATKLVKVPALPIRDPMIFCVDPVSKFK